MARKIPSFLLPAGLIAMALIMGFANLGGWLMNDDEGAYLYGAWRVSLGEVPYRDFFVSQTPLGFYIAAGLFEIFGPTIVAARILSYICLLGASFLIYYALRTYFGFGRNPSLLTAFIWLFTKHNYVLGRMFMPETPMIFFSTAALALALKAESAAEPGKRNGALFLFGLFAGLAAMTKLNAILILFGYGLFTVYLWIRKFEGFRRLRARLIWPWAGFALSFILPFVVILVFVPGAYRATIGFHLAKEKGAVSFLAPVLTRLGQFVGNHDYGLVPVAVVGVIFGWLKDRKRALLLFTTCAVLLQIFIPGTFYLRYIVFALVPLAFFFADGLDVIRSWKKGRWFAGPVAAALILLCLAPSFNPRKLVAYDNGTRALAAFVQRETKPGDYVFGDDPGINFLARRPCPPGLVDVSGAMTRSGQVTAADIKAECERTAAKLILVETAGPAHHLKNLKDYPAFQAYLDESYDRIGVMPREFLVVDVYRRRETKGVIATLRSR